jgi:hypothetical protein
MQRAGLTICEVLELDGWRRRAPVGLKNGLDPLMASDLKRKELAVSATEKVAITGYFNRAHAIDM